MKTLIIVFSQSGYTRIAAECIRDGLVSTPGEECDIINLADADTDKFSDYDQIGIGCPVYYYKEPFHVIDFIENLPDLTGKNWFVFCSHGSIMGAALHLMSERLKKKGAVIVGYYDMYADACSPFALQPTYTTGHPDEIDKEEARSFGRELAERTPRIAQGETDIIPACKPVDEQWIKEAEMLNPEIIKFIIPPYTINQETCIKCHKCEETCPVNGIDIEADPPRVQDPCIGCTYCVMACPTCSIEADWSGMVAHNPEHYKEMRKCLDAAAAKGEFRWLMDPDSIDFEDYMWLQHKRRVKAEKETGDK